MQFDPWKSKKGQLFHKWIRIKLFYIKDARFFPDALFERFAVLEYTHAYRKHRGIFVYRRASAKERRPERAVTCVSLGNVIQIKRV